MKLKKVLIKKCSDSMMWYANHKGKVFDYCGRSTCGLWVRDNEGFINIVRYTDGEVLECAQ